VVLKEGQREQGSVHVQGHPVPEVGRRRHAKLSLENESAKC
jgi:hypothetical protein